MHSPWDATRRWIRYMERGIFRLRRPTSPYVTTPAKMAVASGRGVCGRESSAARLTDREGGVLLELADELALRLLLIREEGEDFRHDCCEGGVGRWSRCGTVTQPADQEELLIRGRGRTVERRDCGSEKQGTCVRSQNRLANVCVDALVMRSTSGERQQDSARRRVQEGQERRAAQARRSTSRTTEKDERQRAARERESGGTSLSPLTPLLCGCCSSCESQPHSPSFLSLPIPSLPSFQGEEGSTAVAALTSESAIAGRRSGNT